MQLREKGNHLLLDRDFKGIAATDFDGTLYRSDRTVSKKNLEALELLGDKNILRVIVTGRSFYSLFKAIEDDFPVDYYIVSSGSGVYSKKGKELIYRTFLPQNEAFSVGEFLLSRNLDFFVHDTLPDNHLFYFHRSGKVNEDFEARIAFYADFGKEMNDLTPIDRGVSQFLVISPPGRELYDLLNEKFPECTIIKTTSPLDHCSSWIEIFPSGTDKGSTLKWLADEYGIKPEAVFSIGNDFNDLHMLRWAKNSFVVKNAAVELRQEFKVVPSNDDDGFTKAVSIWLDEAGL